MEDEIADVLLAVGPSGRARPGRRRRPMWRLRSGMTPRPRWRTLTVADGSSADHGSLPVLAGRGCPVWAWQGLCQGMVPCSSAATISSVTSSWDRSLTAVIRGWRAAGLGS
jgi:hypothetical protein